MREVNVAIDCEKMGHASVECINWVRFHTLLNIFLIFLKTILYNAFIVFRRVIKRLFTKCFVAVGLVVA